MSELKPCPFCGSSNLTRSVDGGILPDFIDSARYDYREKPYYITCTLTCDDCGAMLQGYTATGKHEDCEPRDAIRDAYIKWDTRAERTCSDASVDSATQFYCSECECTVDIPILWGAVNYCPNCGAKVVDE